MVKGYEEHTIPNFKQLIKIAVQQESFNKRTYKAFAKINSTDSTMQKRQYLRLDIADKVAVINALNDKANTVVKDYLSINPKAQMITQLSIVFDEAKHSALIVAEEVFLETNGVKSFALGLYTAGKKTQTLTFNEGIIFDYELSGFCWQENNKRKIQIVDMVDGRSCPRKTYNAARKAKKRINYYKF